MEWPVLSDEIYHQYLPVVPIELDKALKRLSAAIERLDRHLYFKDKRMLFNNKTFRLSHQKSYRLFNRRSHFVAQNPDWIKWLDPSCRDYIASYHNLAVVYFCQSPELLIHLITEDLESIQKETKLLLKQLARMQKKAILPEEARDPIYRYVLACDERCETHKSLLIERVLGEFSGKWQALIDVSDHKRHDHSDCGILKGETNQYFFLESQSNWQLFVRWAYRLGHAVQKRTIQLLHNQLAKGSYAGMLLHFDAMGDLTCRFPFIDAVDCPAGKTSWPFLFRGRYVRYKLTRDILPYVRIAYALAQVHQLLAKDHLNTDALAFCGKMLTAHAAFVQALKSMRASLWSWFHADAIHMVAGIDGHAHQIKKHYFFCHIKSLRRRLPEHSEDNFESEALDFSSVTDLISEWQWLDKTIAYDADVSVITDWESDKIKRLNNIIRRGLAWIDRILCAKSKTPLTELTWARTHWMMMRGTLWSKASTCADQKQRMLFSLYDYIFEQLDPHSIDFDLVVWKKHLLPCLPLWSWSHTQADQLRFLQIRQVPAPDNTVDLHCLFLAYCLKERVIDYRHDHSNEQEHSAPDMKEQAADSSEPGLGSVMMPSQKRNLAKQARQLRPVIASFIARRLSRSSVSERFMQDEESFFNPLLDRSWQAHLLSIAKANHGQDIAENRMLVQGLNNSNLFFVVQQLWYEQDMLNLSASQRDLICMACDRVEAIRRHCLESLYQHVLSVIGEGKKPCWTKDKDGLFVLQAVFDWMKAINTVEANHLFDESAGMAHTFMKQSFTLLCKQGFWHPVWSFWSEQHRLDEVIASRRVWFKQVIETESFGERYEDAYVTHEDYSCIPLFLGCDQPGWTEITQCLKSLDFDRAYLSHHTVSWLSSLMDYCHEFNQLDDLFVSVKHWPKRVAIQSALSTGWVAFCEALDARHYEQAYQSLNRTFSMLKEKGVFWEDRLSRWIATLEKHCYSLMVNYLYKKRHSFLSRMHKLLLIPINASTNLSAGWRMARWSFMCTHLPELMPIARGGLQRIFLKALNSSDKPCMNPLSVLFFTSGLVERRYYERLIEEVSAARELPGWANEIVQLTVSRLNSWGEDSPHLYACLRFKEVVYIALAGQLHPQDPLCLAIHSACPASWANHLGSLLRADASPITQALTCYQQWQGARQKSGGRFLGRWFSAVSEGLKSRLMTRAFMRMCKEIRHLYLVYSDIASTESHGAGAGFLGESPSHLFCIAYQQAGFDRDLSCRQLLSADDEEVASREDSPIRLVFEGVSGD
jgi:hypothetical protein